MTKFFTTFLFCIAANTATAAASDGDILSAFETFCIWSPLEKRIETLQFAGATRVDPKISEAFLAPQTGQTFSLEAQGSKFVIGITDKDVCDMFSQSGNANDIETLLQQRFRTSLVNSSHEGGDDVDLFLLVAPATKQRFIVTIRKPALTSDKGGVSMAALPPNLTDIAEGLWPQ